MKKVSCMFLAALLLLASACENQEPAQTTSEPISIANASFDTSLYMEPDYAVFSRPASQNGMGDTLVQVCGSIVELSSIDELSYAIVESDEGDAWMIGYSPDILDKVPDFKIGDRAVFFGTYSGVSRAVNNTPFVYLLRYITEEREVSLTVIGFIMAYQFEPHEGQTALASSTTAMPATLAPALTTARATVAAADTAAPSVSDAPASGGTSPYQSIHDEYTQKLKDATPKLVKEYHDKAAVNTGGVTGLADLCNSLIALLAEISTDGIAKMASVMLATDGDYGEYEAWSGKLMDVYTDEAGKIMDAYNGSV